MHVLPLILWHVKAHEDDQQEEGHVARTERPRNLLAIAKQQHIQHLQGIPNILQKSRRFLFPLNPIGVQSLSNKEI